MGHDLGRATLELDDSRGGKFRWPPRLYRTDTRRRGVYPGSVEVGRKRHHRVVLDDVAPARYSPSTLRHVMRNESSLLATTRDNAVDSGVGPAEPSTIETAKHVGS